MKYNQNNCFCFVYYYIFTSLLYCTNFHYLYFTGVVLFWKNYFTTYSNHSIVLFTLLYLICDDSSVRVFNDLFFFNESVKSIYKSHWTIHSQIGLSGFQLFSCQKRTDSNDPVRASLQLTIHWIHKSDSKWAKNGRSEELYCKRKSYLGCKFPFPLYETLEHISVYKMYF